MTSAIRATTGSDNRMERIAEPPSIGSGVKPERRTMTPTQMQQRRVMSSPGTMPAMNRLAIGVSVTTP